MLKAEIGATKEEGTAEVGTWGGNRRSATVQADIVSLKSIEIRWLPVATPELNTMGHLWRHTRRETLGSRATLSVEESALVACRYISGLSRRDRLRQAGILSGNFWLTK